MSLLTIVLVIIAVGVLLWLVNTYIPMQSTVKSILNLVVIVLLILWLLSAFGVIDVFGGTDRVIVPCGVGTSTFAPRAA